MGSRITEQVEGSVPALRLVLAFCGVFLWLFGWGEGLSVCFPYPKKKKEEHNVREILENVRKRISYKPSGPGRRAPLLALFAAALRVHRLRRSRLTAHPVSSLEVPCKHVSVGLLIIKRQPQQNTASPLGAVPWLTCQLHFCPSAQRSLPPHP